MSEVLYRCCPHCAEDMASPGPSLHGVPKDEHDVPCNVPESQGCVGRQVVSGEDNPEPFEVPC